MNILPNFIKFDFWRKLISLIFAILVWWRISIQIGSEEIIRNVPVKINDNAQAVVVDPDMIPSVNLIVRTVSGKRLLLSPSDFKIEINLPARDPGGLRAVEYNIERDADIKKPFGVKILSMEPSKITFNIDRMTHKKVPVLARFSGNLSDEFACGEVKLSPDEVEVIGPESRLKNLIRANTEPIILDSGIREDFERLVKVESIGQQINFVPDKISAIVEIYRKHDRRVFKGLPVLVLSSFDFVSSVRRVSPTNVDVIVSGPKGLIETLELGDVVPFVRLDGTTVRESELKVNCYISNPELKVVSITPSHIKVFSSGEK